MARARHEEEHENHERWLVSYADFITLLFAFFVVMYAMSSINEGKYRVLSDSMVSVFEARQKAPELANIGEPARSPIPSPDAIHPGRDFGGPRADYSEQPAPGPEEAAGVLPEGLNLPGPKAEGMESPGAQPAGEQAAGEFERDYKGAQAVAEVITTALDSLIERKLIDVRRGEEWVEVEMKSSILFDRGSARLATDAIPILTEVAGALNAFANPMQVEGFTDDRPINTVAYPSNWELSAARSASVVHLFAKLDIDPRRLSAVGFGEFRPKADNATAEGRAQNRRVVVRISTGDRAAGSMGSEAVPGAAAPGAAATPEARGSAAGFRAITNLPEREGPDR